MLALAYLAITPTSYSTELHFTHSPDGLRAYNSVPSINYSETHATAELAQRLSSWENFHQFLQASEAGKAALDQVSAASPNDNPITLSRRLFGNRFDFTSPGEQSLIGSIRYQYQKEHSSFELVNAYFSWTLTEYTHELTERANRAIDSAILQNERQMHALIEA